MDNVYGLKKHEMEILQRILVKHADIIEQVMIFGSRARGDHRPGSDIDLAVFTWNENQDLLSIKEELELSNLIQTVDVVHYQTITNDALRKEIDQEGRLIFKATKEGGIALTNDKLVYKYQDYQKALTKLKESLERDPHTDDLVLDATIQRFEFTYELAWKLMKAYLQYMGNNEATNPRSTFREAYKEGLLSEGDAWLQMLQDRNMTAHTYDEKTAWAIWENIRGKHVKSLEALATEMNVRVRTHEGRFG